MGNLAAEFLFERHHEFDGVQAVRAQIIDEAGVVGDLVGLYSEMLDHDLLPARCDIAHWCIPSALSLIQAVAVCFLPVGTGPVTRTNATHISGTAPPGIRPIRFFPGLTAELQCS